MSIFQGWAEHPLVNKIRTQAQLTGRIVLYNAIGNLLQLALSDDQGPEEYFFSLTGKKLSDIEEIERRYLDPNSKKVSRMRIWYKDDPQPRCYESKDAQSIEQICLLKDIRKNIKDNS